MSEQKVKLLALCDAPDKDSGFARVARNLLKRWAARGAVVDCWGIGHVGWPHGCEYINKMFPAGNTWNTPGMLSEFLTTLRDGGYTHVWVMQDMFMLLQSDFPEQFQKICHNGNITSVYYFPVDAPLEKEWVPVAAAFDVRVAYTEYGRRELQRAAAKLERELEVVVIPHGVDTSLYQPVPPERRAFLRDKLYKPAWPPAGSFVMMNVSQHQRRKDVTRSLEILRGLIDATVPARLVMHMVRRTELEGVDLECYAQQLGFKYGREWGHHTAFFPPNGKLTEETLAKYYANTDLFLSTTLGEGWGLPGMEALACGCPIALPAHTACAEIMTTLSRHGMHDRILPLPVEKWGTVAMGDNTRRRHRVDVDGAVAMIKGYYDQGKWRQRPALNDWVKEWQSWDRIAGEFWRLFRGEKIQGEAAIVKSEVRSEKVEAEPVKGAIVKSEVRSQKAEAEPVKAETAKEIIGIPLLAVPIVNRADLLLRLIGSIDAPINNLLILNNGADINAEQLAKEVHELIGKQIEMFEVTLPHPKRSCAESWNYALNLIRQDKLPYVMIASNDVAFGPGDLAVMHEFVMAHLDHAVLFGHSHNWFAVTKTGLDVVGTFDENIWPAYLEDCDHFHRCKLLNAAMANVPGVHAIHGEEMPDQTMRGSCTIYSDAKIMDRNAITQGNNFVYYKAKWGGINSQEKFANPFNCAEWSPKDWIFLPNFRKAQMELRSVTEADILAEVASLKNVGPLPRENSALKEPPYDQFPK